MNRARPNILFILTAWIVQFLGVFWYLSKETSTPFWDYAMYADMATGLFHLPTLAAQGDAFFGSFAQKYNLLFTLPSLLGFSLFSATRNVFILTNFLFFMLPYQAAVGLIFSRLFSWPYRKALAYAVGLSFFIPFLWFPLLQGYPDTGSAACLALGVGLWVGRKQGGRKQGARRAIGVGLLLALSIILRRHYAYPALGFMLSFGLMDLWRQRHLRMAIPYIYMGCAALGGLLCVEPHYLIDMVTTDYIALYKPYERSAAYFLAFTASRWGLFLALSCLYGLFLAFRQAPTHRFVWAQGLSFVFLATLLWALGPSQAGEHYLIAVLPLLAFMGLGGMLHFSKTHHAALLVGMLLFQTVFIFLPRQAFPLPSDDPTFSLFGTPRPPWVRKDQSALKQIVQDIEKVLRPDDRLVVVGSSFILNQDLLLKTFEAEAYDPTALKRHMLSAPEMGGVESAPLDVLAQGTLFVVPDVPQYHLSPEGQRAVTALWKIFDDEAFAQQSGFDRVSGPHMLLRNVSVSLWRRVSFSPQALHLSLTRSRSILDDGREWVSFTGNGMDRAFGPGLPFFFAGTFFPQEKQKTLFMDKVFSSGSYRLDVKISPSSTCAPPDLRFRFLSEKGELIKEEKKSLYVVGKTLGFPVILPPEKPELYLFLDVFVPDAPRPCSLFMEKAALVRE